MVLEYYFGYPFPSFHINQKVLQTWCLSSFLKAPCHPISAGFGLMLINSSFEYSNSGLPCDHPPHCCQCDCSEMEIWSFLCNSLVSLTSQSLVWSKMLVGSIFKNFCDLVPTSFSGAYLVGLQNLSVPALLNTCHYSKFSWVFTALQVASSIVTAWIILPLLDPKK